jgi:hypothetical protein
MTGGVGTRMVDRTATCAALLKLLKQRQQRPRRWLG